MILLTGATGFLGKTIIKELGPAVSASVGRSDSTFNVDLSRDIARITGQYEIVVHAAGKAHSVPKNADERQMFFDVNVTGTANLLKGLEQLDVLPKAFVFISSVAVYGMNTGNAIDENSPLNAVDAYGKSKIEAEIIVSNWCLKHGIVCSILRLPLLAGPNPPGNLAAMIKGLEKNYYFNIAGGTARKSMVLASDVALIIPVVAKIGGIYNLTDGCHPSFSELSIKIAEQLGKAKPMNIPYGIASLIAKIGDLLGTKAPLNSNKFKKIVTDLTFDDRKARELLKWSPMPVLKEFLIE
ncbi:NAD-dependent epimerase/dehydratase family protein [Pedobacter sp. FW305-3-2-15-E-R2A2]|uniref:NAD-dependent epimerase/dehydratase family protein n=1 Tax=Pedobacter sp. FW305-3-2-15-E-R2A2 TaxID=3140251 RepID=UPI0031406025